MKLKKLFVLGLIATSTLSFGQEADQQETKKSKFRFGAFFGMGNSTLEHNLLGTLNSDVYALRFNVDYSLSKDEKFKVISGVDILGCNAGFYDGANQKKLLNSYLQIPVKISTALPLDKDDKLNFVTHVGTYVNFLIDSSIYANGDKINTKSGGVNMGLTFALGMEYKLSSDTTIGINADVLSEFSAISKNGYEQKQTALWLFNVGFMQRF